VDEHELETDFAVAAQDGRRAIQFDGRPRERVAHVRALGDVERPQQESRLQLRRESAIGERDKRQLSGERTIRFMRCS
jgi:hypothetical protein